MYTLHLQLYCNFKDCIYRKSYIHKLNAEFYLIVIIYLYMILYMCTYIKRKEERKGKRERIVIANCH